MFNVYKGITCLQRPTISQEELVEEYVWLNEAHGHKSVDELHGRRVSQAKPNLCWLKWDHWLINCADLLSICQTNWRWDDLEDFSSNKATLITAAHLRRTPCFPGITGSTVSLWWTDFTCSTQIRFANLQTSNSWLNNHVKDIYVTWPCFFSMSVDA